MMLLEQERLDVVTYGNKLVADGLTTGTGGNISILNREAGLFAISPSGIAYHETEPEDVVVMDLEGNVVDGVRKPSSEHSLHRIFYTDRDDIASVVHTHSTYSTVLATLRESLPASSYLIAFAGVDVRCGRYATYGSPELARFTFTAMQERKAALMANHGLVTGGTDIRDAYNIAMQVEQCAKVYVLSRAIGKPAILPLEEMEKMVVSFRESYGQVKSKAEFDQED